MGKHVSCALAMEHSLLNALIWCELRADAEVPEVVVQERLKVLRKHHPYAHTHSETHAQAAVVECGTPRYRVRYSLAVNRSEGFTWIM